MTIFLQKHSRYILLLAIAILFVPNLTWASMGTVEGVVWTIVVNFFGLFMALGAFFLDIGINSFVIDFGEMYQNGGIGLAVDTAWVSVRDIFNITFIFGLVYIGFKMILDSSNSNTKRWLAYLIMAAIFVNFSLLITKFVVDVSNTIASQIAISGFTTESDTSDGDFGYPTVSATFADSMGMTSLLAFDRDGDAAKNYGEGGAWGYIFGTMIFFLVAGFVFAAGGMLLVIRAGALLFYLVLSPFMFIGWVFPQLQKYTSEYWSGFLGRAFFAPLYILFLFLSAKILQDFTAATEDREGAAAAGTLLQTPTGVNINDLFFTSFVPFILACIFLVMSIKIADKLGAHGASASISFGKSLSNRVKRGVGNVTVGTTASVARNTLGRYATSYMESDKGKRRAANGYFGKKAYSAASGVAGASFDARRVGNVGKNLGIGEGVKGGYKKTVDERRKAEEKFAKDLGKEEIKDENGEIKPEFKEKIQQAVQDNEILVGAKENLSKANTNKEETGTALEEHSGKLAGLVTAYDKALSIGDTSTAKAIDVEIEDHQKRLEQSSPADIELTKRLTDEAKRAASLVRTSTEQVKKAEKEARAIEESKAIYARQLAYIKQLESSSRMWGLGSPIGGAVATGIGSILGLSVAAGAAVSAPVVLAGSAVGSRSSYAAESLKKTYGKDGRKALKKEKRKDELKILSEEMKENDVVDKAPEIKDRGSDSDVG